jgi:hypothetical protein
VIRIRIHPASKPKNDYASQVYPRQSIDRYQTPASLLISMTLSLILKKLTPDWRRDFCLGALFTCTVGT